MPVPIQIEHVTKVFGSVCALDDVNLEIRAGELFFLLGPSGCGKTTLLRCIAGFCIPEQGRILIDGVDVARVPPHRRDTAMVFQSYALWPHMSVFENVAFGLEQRGLPRAEIRRRVDEALDRVHLRDRADMRPQQLSGGQQQRVALARALAVQPRCLLLDEPLSNLDAKLRLEMRSEIRQLCKSAGVTAVYVTHDQKEALSIADRLAVLDAGRVVQVGTPLEIYRQPVNRFVAGFIGEANFIEGVLERVIADRAWVRTPWGTVVGVLPGTSGVAADVASPVTVCVRPEAIRLVPDATGVDNLFEGVVRESVYLGEMAQYRVESLSPAAPPLKVFELHPRHLIGGNGDRKVRLGFRAEDVILLDIGGRR